MVAGLEKVREGNAARGGRRAGVVGFEAIDVEEVGNVDRAVGEASGIERERMHRRGRRDAGEEAGAVYKRRRDVGEAFEREDGNRIFLAGDAVRAKEYALEPDVPVVGMLLAIRVAAALARDIDSSEL